MWRTKAVIHSIPNNFYLRYRKPQQCMHKERIHSFMWLFFNVSTGTVAQKTDWLNRNWRKSHVSLRFHLSWMLQQSQLSIAYDFTDGLFAKMRCSRLAFARSLAQQRASRKLASWSSGNFCETEWRGSCMLRTEEHGSWSALFLLALFFGWANSTCSTNVSEDSCRWRYNVGKSLTTRF